MVGDGVVSAPEQEDGGAREQGKNPVGPVIEDEGLGLKSPGQGRHGQRTRQGKNQEEAIDQSGAFQPFIESFFQHMEGKWGA